MTFSSHTGDILSSRAFAGFLLTEISYRAQRSLPKHAHERACFSFVSRGSYVEWYGDRRLEARRSQIVYRPAGEVHSDAFTEPDTRCLLIEFDPQWLDGRLRLRGPSTHGGDELVRVLTRLRSESRSPDDFTAMSIEGLMLELAVAINRKPPKRESVAPRWLRLATEIVHEQFSETLSLSHIATHIGVHPVHLATTFRQHHDCTVGEYIRRVRVEFARGKLATTDEPLSAIALAAGFYDQSHFCRTFKRVAGVTPAQYRVGAAAPKSVQRP